MKKETGGRRRETGVALLVWVVLVTSACNVGPKYVKPSTPVAPAFKEPLPLDFKEAKGWKLGEPKDDMHRGKWWETFNDPQLNALEEQIDTANQSLQAAEATFRGARAGIRVARAGLYPNVTAGASVLGVGSGASGSGGGGAGASGGSGGGGARQSASLTIPTVGATWEADLWGRIRNTIEAGVATAQASAGDLETLRLLIQTEVATDYFQLHGLDADKQLLDSNVTAYEQALKLTVNRYNQGVASMVDVAQAQTQLEQTRAQGTETTVQRQQLEHAIAILIGKTPAEFSIPIAPIKSSPPVIPGVLPSELLERRPDIAANERRVAAANATVGATKAAFYPTITLGASGGLASNSLLTLFTWPSRFWSLGPTAATTLFDAGKRRGTTEQAQAQYDVAVANYRESVLTAFQNVEDNLATLRILEQEAKEQAAAVQWAERSLQLANNQYVGGITTYLQVITAQAAALSNERTALDITTRRMTASVALIQALGGGWEASQIPSKQEVTPKSPTP